MTSDPVFVWTWLPGTGAPVVAGRIDRPPTGPVVFTYGRSYLERDGAIALYEPELPLVDGPARAADGDGVPLCVDDSGPDAWGRRVINYRAGIDSSVDLDDLSYLAASGGGIGALAFTASSSDPPSGSDNAATLDELSQASLLVEQGAPLPDTLAKALLHGTSVGGARPKALLSDGDRHLIAKFSSGSDDFPFVQSEFVAMTLAAHAGLDVAAVEYREVMGRHALLVDRFDRVHGSRRRMVSALTMLGLDAFLSGRYATYFDLADVIRHRFDNPDATLRELFSRIVFNVLCSNTDDHGKNHAAFWDGRTLTLTPGYDISPQRRSGETARQAMAYAPIAPGTDANNSRVADVIAAASIYHLDRSEAGSIVDAQVTTMRERWDEVCDQARLGSVDRARLWGRQFCNPAAFYRS